MTIFIGILPGKWKLNGKRTMKKKREYPSGTFAQKRMFLLITRRRRCDAALLCLAILVSFSGCKKEKVPEPYQPSYAHDGYRHSLEAAGLDDTALGRDWIAASKSALTAPVEITLPFAEVFYVDPGAAFAVGYRFDVERGQRIEVEAEFRGEVPGRLFVDLYRSAGPTDEQAVHVASADEGDKRLEFEPRRDATYLVRFQPELLRGGQYAVTIRKVASLGFPVAGKDSRAIQSGFGQPRDGGRRVHRGVDIFAARHTPVLAPSDAYVRRVGDDQIGGKTVWLTDNKRSLVLYFAHLQTQDVEPYTEVQAGQQIGTVGNSGNARTTPPHLHFGVYMRPGGAVDPYHFITGTNDRPPPVSAALDLLGDWGRSTVRDVSLRASPGSRSRQLTFLDEGSLMKVLAASGSKYRVLLPDGLAGYLPAGGVEAVAVSLENHRSQWAQEVKEAPRGEAATKEVLQAGDEFRVLGRYAESWFIQTKSGRRGWIPTPGEMAEERER